MSYRGSRAMGAQPSAFEIGALREGGTFRDCSGCALRREIWTAFRFCCCEQPGGQQRVTLSKPLREAFVFIEQVELIHGAIAPSKKLISAL